MLTDTLGLTVKGIVIDPVSGQLQNITGSLQVLAKKIIDESEL